MGLHYFGARYYSSYLGRWLSPDAPVVHSGGYTNFYNYGANSPYIYVDPDGNFIQAIIGAIVGAVVGVVTTLATGGDWKHALLNGLIGAAVGAVTGGVGSVVSSAAASAGATAFSAAVAGAVASSATAAAMNFAISVASGANTGQAALNAGMSFAIGVIGGMAGAGIGRAGISAVGTFVANTAVNAGLSAGATVIKAAAYSGGDLSESDFDDTMRDWAVGTFIGTAASAVSAGVEGLAASGTTGGDDDVIIGTPQDYKSEIRRSGNGATRTFTEEKNVPHVSKQISAYVEDKSRINCTGWALGRNSKIMPRMGTAEKPGATVPEMFNDLGYKMKEVEFNDIKESDIIVHYLKRPNGQTYGPEDGQIQMMMEGKLTHKVDIHTEIVTKVYNTKDSMGVNQVHTESMAGQFVKGTEPDVWKRVISPYEKYYRLVPK